MRKFLLIILLTWLAFSCKKTGNNESSGLAIHGITPDTGLANTVVTITGSGFDTTVAKDLVTFNGKSALVQTATPTTLVVTVPDTTSGPVAVSVGGRQVQGPLYMYQTMHIDSVSPMEGAAGTLVTITGSGMVYNSGHLDLQPSVTFNGRQASVRSYSAGKLVVAVPDSAGNGPLAVALGPLRAGIQTYYFLGIDSAGPLSGAGGTVMTLKGGFGPDPTKVKISISGNPAVIKSVSDSEVVVTVPQGAVPGSGKITATVGSQVFTGPSFAYVPPPTITQILPTSGPVGTPVTITGAVFSTIPVENVVTFNGTHATVTQASATQLTVTVPAGATTGAVAIDVNGQAVTGPSFTVQNLGVYSVYPVSGSPGDLVTIQGAGFSATPGQDQVSINGMPVSVSSATSTKLVIVVPAGFTPGLVTVATGGLTANWPIAFQANLPGVTTFAGGSLNPSLFGSPADLAIDANGNIYVTDQGYADIVKITPIGETSFFAGVQFNGGFKDGQGAAARFNSPTGIAVDGQGNLYVADNGNYAIRKITPDGTVSTLIKLSYPPYGVAVDASGNIFVSSGNSFKVYEYDASGGQSQVLNLNAPDPYGSLYWVSVDATGNVYTSFYGYGGIVENTSTLLADGDFSAYSTKGICLDGSGNLIVADGGNRMIYSINPTVQNPTIQTVAGSGNYDDNNGPLLTASFENPVSVRVDAQGNIWVVDQGDRSIRKVSLK